MASFIFNFVKSCPCWSVLLCYYGYIFFSENKKVGNNEHSNNSQYSAFNPQLIFTINRIIHPVCRLTIHNIHNINGKGKEEKEAVNMLIMESLIIHIVSSLANRIPLGAKINYIMPDLELSVNKFSPQNRNAFNIAEKYFYFCTMENIEIKQ
ncbi:MAG: hypothetical protein LBV47_08550 [Bacteroidales bacterium]|jgi:hypothetical protein|nr:hypothetical protein [Bacteroidales bacterium]